MSFNISPQINIFERDFTQTIALNYSTVGAQAGKAQWGPVGIQTLLTTGLKGLLGTFFKPDDDTYLSWLVAKDFLQYSNIMYFYRVAGANARNAADNITALIAALTFPLSNGVANGVDTVSTAVLVIDPFPVELSLNSNIELGDAWAITETTTNTVINGTVDETDLTNGFVSADFGATVARATTFRFTGFFNHAGINSAVVAANVTFL